MDRGGIKMSKALELLKEIKSYNNKPLRIMPSDKKFNEAIAELEALQQRSCAKCKSFKLDDEHNDGFGQCFWGIHFPNGNSSSYHKGIDFYCSEFEAKEQ